MISIALVVTALAVIVLILAFIMDSVFLGAIAIIIGTVSINVYLDGTPEHQAQVKADAIAAQKAAIPHVIRDVDGCKVYAFTAGGHEHYYTRCAESVTTERFYTVPVPCGKACTRQEPRSEVIVTSKGP